MFLILPMTKKTKFLVVKIVDIILNNLIKIYTFKYLIYISINFNFYSDLILVRFNIDLKIPVQNITLS